MNQPSTLPSMVPTDILEDLKKYNSHVDNMLCLECGYQGKMGVKKSGLQPFSAAFLALIFTAVMGATGYLGIIWLSALFGFFWVFIMQMSAQPTLSCPHCHAEVDKQGKLKPSRSKTNKNLKWHEILIGLAIGVISIVLLAANDIST
ncbi:hypothetical protein JWZ98_11210 [Methylomonas sp. EFPC1]|uniref:hypothetical protein n=1 Tax=Methylomonas sp. EFPC1 TaxID=2812647 RepID=UPI001967D632|nr:hypothetical protein [Methylomonas sp. EFPC1]QSB03445.1 hypothetical protein JWZ98_11210 [Methylomonas sp. EFPC1]